MISYPTRAEERESVDVSKSENEQASDNGNDQSSETDMHEAFRKFRSAVERAKLLARLTSE